MSRDTTNSRGDPRFLSAALHSNEIFGELGLLENHPLDDDSSDDEYEEEEENLAAGTNSARTIANHYGIAAAAAATTPPFANNQGLRAFQMMGDTQIETSSNGGLIEPWQNAASSLNMITLMDLLSDSDEDEDDNGDDDTEDSCSIVELSHVIRNRQSVKVLHFKNDSISSILSSTNNLRSVAPLESLTLDGVNLLPRRRGQTTQDRKRTRTEDYREILCRVLASKSSLQCLSLVGCCLEDDGTTMLAKFILRPNKGSLKHLDLSNNTINWRGATALGLTLKNHNRILQEIILDYNRAGNDGGKTFAEAIVGESPDAIFSPLTKLSLSNNEMGPEVGHAFGKALSNTTTPSRLRHLNLHSNDLQDEGVEAICKGLQKNTMSVLGYLDVGFNGTGEVAAEAMARAIKLSPVNVLTHVIIGDESQEELSLNVIRKLASAVQNKMMSREQQAQAFAAAPRLGASLPPLRQPIVVLDIVGDEKASLFSKAFQLVVNNHCRNDEEALGEGIVPHVLVCMLRHSQQRLEKKKSMKIGWQGIVDVLSRGGHVVSLENSKVLSSKCVENERNDVERWRIEAVYGLLSDLVCCRG